VIEEERGTPGKHQHRACLRSLARYRFVSILASGCSKFARRGIAAACCATARLCSRPTELRRRCDADQQAVDLVVRHSLERDVQSQPTARRTTSSVAPRSFYRLNITEVFLVLMCKSCMIKRESESSSKGGRVELSLYFLKQHLRGASRSQHRFRRSRP
jgi:hypothetical protein